MEFTTFGFNPIPIIALLIGLVYGIGFVIVTLHSTKYALYLLFCVVTFGNFASDYGLLPHQVNWATELSIFILFFKSVLSKKSDPETSYRFIFPLILVFFLHFTIVSSIINQTNLANVILELRLMFRYIVLFIVLINLHLEESEEKQINKFIVFLILLQLPVALIKFFIYGQGERAVGTYSGIHGGTLSTLLPLVVIPFAIGYYIHQKRSINYIFICMAFVGFSVIGGKKAFIFYLPVLLFYCFTMFRRDFVNVLTTKTLIIGIIFLFGSFWLTTSYVDRINPEKVGKYLRDPRKKGYSAILDYVIAYNTIVSKDGVAHGRLSSTLKVFELLNQKGISGWILGYGPGTWMKSRFVDANAFNYSKIPIGYGRTQFNWVLYQFGIIPTILYFMIIFKLLLYTKKAYPNIKENYWKAFFFGFNAFCFTYIFLGLTYCTTILSDFLPCIYFYLAAVAVKKAEGVV